MARDAGRNPTEDYKSAMRTWQNDYNKVTARHGLARIGPARRRLTRGQWQIEKAEVERRGEQLRRIKTEEAAVGEAKELLANAIKIPMAIGIAMRAWCDGEINDEGQIVQQVEMKKKRTILKAIEPTEKLVRDLIIKISHTASLCSSDSSLTEYRNTVRRQADIIAPDSDGQSDISEYPPRMSEENKDDVAVQIQRPMM
jgi:hypothetical protein